MKFTKILCLGIAIVMMASGAHARGGKSGGGKGKSGGGYYSYYPNPVNVLPVQTYSEQQLSEMIRKGQADAIREVTKRVAKSGSYIDGIAYLSTLPGFKEEIRFAKVWMNKNDIEILNKLVPGAYQDGMAEYNKPLRSLVRNLPLPCCW